MNGKQEQEIPEHLLSSLFDGRPDGRSETELRSILKAGQTFSYPDADTGKAWNRFLSSTGAHLQVETKVRRFGMFRWVAAAVIILTAGLSIGRYAYNKANTYTAEFVSVEGISTHTLPDGTVIRLNKGSRVNVLAMNKSERTLKFLGGEIYLDVVHNELPFTVITDKGDIHVLGTQFSVRSAKGLPFSVYLRKGKIRFETGKQSKILDPGQAIVEQEDGRLAFRLIQDNRYTAWTDGKLIFENRPLSEVIAGLQSAYNRTFEYDTQLASEKITITFENLNAEQAAGLLSKTVNSNIRLLPSENR